MVIPKSTGLFLLVLMGLALLPNNAAGVAVYRIGTAFSAAERDSLQDLGFDVREISWSFSALEEGLDPEALAAGSMQPVFFDEDENIAATALSRGGWIYVSVGGGNLLVGQVLLDADPTTAYVLNQSSPSTFSPGLQVTLTVDLGGRFLVKEVRFRPSPEHPERFLQRYRINTDVGEVTTGRFPPFQSRVEVRENTEPNVRVPFDPPLETRFVQLTIFRQTPKAIELVELEVFGGGFVNQASYVSDVIQLDDLASWGSIRWSGRQDPGARVDIRTRSGADPQPEIFWMVRPEQQDSVKYLHGGGELSAGEYKDRYESLANIYRPSDPQDRVSTDTRNWSYWSHPYAFEKPGVEVVSPGPRQFVQLRADFASTTHDGGRIDYIEFRASVPPAVTGIVGEVFPVEAEVGEVTRFTYYIKPTIRVGDLGFDRVAISTPSGFGRVDSLRIDGVDQVDFSWALSEDGLGFEVVLPRKMGIADSGVVLAVVFDAPVLREVGTFFDGKVFDSTHPHEVRQRINPGDAADEVESEVLSVRAALSPTLLYAPRVEPNPFTPNGDGINDLLRISYTLLRVTAPVPVSIGIYDLAGTLVKEVYSGDDPIGRYARSWDGTNRSGDLVPPGIYLCRILVDLQAREEIQSGIVSVVY